MQGHRRPLHGRRDVDVDLDHAPPTWRERCHGAAVQAPAAHRKDLRTLSDDTRDVGVDDVLGRAARDEPAGVEQVDDVAAAADRGEVVAHEQDREAEVGDLLDLVEALSLELLVANGEHLVDDEHLRFEMGRDREAQPHLHAAREVLHGCVDEALDPGELDDRVELLTHLGAAHPEDRSREEDVLPPREVDVEAGADLEQRADPPADLGPAFGRHRDARQELEQRALPRAVATDDPGHLSGHDLEVDVA